jgi:16S rRNA (guanine527-N7)-methyltransferase
MDRLFQTVLMQGAEALGLCLSQEAVGRLERYADQLLIWNRKINLTAVTEPAELAEKHFVDSLALLRTLEVSEGLELLDIGSGAGLPGMALACARDDLRVTCCDSIAKKVAFVKAAAVAVGLRGRGVVARAGGKPELEGLPRAGAVVSRALAAPDQWVPLGCRYLAPGGRLFAMLGREAGEDQLRAIGAENGLVLEVVDRFQLPVTGAQRAIARWRSAE